MTSLCQQVELPKNGLYPFDVVDEIRLLSAGSRGCHHGPAVNAMGDYGEGRVRSRLGVVLTKPLVKQVDQLVCGYAFSSHEVLIANARGFANLRIAA